MSESVPNYVSLFSGAGGLDIGLERAGLRARSLCEIEPVFCETLKCNSEFRHADGLEYFASADILNADVRELSASDLNTCGESVDLVVGGPPCQAFSSAGKQLSVLDPNGMLVAQFYRLIDELQPRMFLFENVRGVVTARDANGEPGGVVKGLLNSFKEIDYSCRAGLLNSADYGAFQRRVRCFIVGTRCGQAPSLPVPTHQRTPSLFSNGWRSLGEFLDTHEDTNEALFTYPTEALAVQLAALKDGSGLKSMGKRERTRPGGHWGYRQGTFIADQTLPARTVTGSASQDWVRRDGVLRRITLREAKLLQGFPEDWIIKGTKAKRFKQIGNAVPASFGELLGTMIRDFLSAYPDTPPVHLDMPKEFKGYIDYTKKDHARNHASRSVHKNFGTT
jgi:DNA (cytosine-5)-methyltransferase 1